MDILANNGNGGGHVACPYINENSNSWFDLLGDANDAGVNKFWLYASNTGDENGIKEFCNSAWERGWLLRKQVHEVVIWQCYSADPCNSCGFPDVGRWRVQYSYYVGDPIWVNY